LFDGAENSQDNVTLDASLAGLHLLVKRSVSNDARCISDFSAGLVQPRDGSHDRAFLHIGQLGDLVEWLS
jgi:hypothetical protein